MEATHQQHLELVHKVALDVASKGGRVYFVGGYVRDKIMGIDSKDIDVEVFGITPKTLYTILSQYGKVDKVGASFGVYMIKGLDIDFTMPRRERKVGNKHTDFEVEVDPFMSIEAAARRRDFTMNAIMQDVLTGNILDPYNGVRDIEIKRLTYIDEDTFVEDELRAFRACQFSSRFEMIIDSNTEWLCQDFTYEMLPKERIFDEIKKGLLKSKNPSIMFNNMKKLGILDKLFPELVALKSCPQDSKYHPEGSVWKHSMLVLDYLATIKHLSKDPLALMLAGLLHDIGKPVTVKKILGRVISHGHAGAGVPIAEGFLLKLTNQKRLTKRVLKLVENHMRPHQIMHGSDKAVRKLMRETDIYELLLLSEADFCGRGTLAQRKRGDYDYTEIRTWFHAKINKLSEGNIPGKITPLVQGKDLIKLGFKPGPHFQIILDKAMELQLEGWTKEQILAEVRRCLV